ncbi:DnaB-like helicase N-terminal domain-containing protein [Thiohalocapsa marina]|nr:DnaB-like helicase N-terminal domain-containing protein [Thiohalocapsa marina]
MDINSSARPGATGHHRTTYTTERAFLAGIFAEPACIGQYADALDPHDISDPYLSETWSAMIACHRARELPEFAAVIGRLRDPQHDLLAELATEGATAANCGRYAEAIRAAARAARLRALGQRLTEVLGIGSEQAGGVIVELLGTGALLKARRGSGVAYSRPPEAAHA